MSTAPKHRLDAVASGVAERCPDSYRLLYDLTANRLYAFAHRLLSDRQDAEDAVQQAFLELTRTDAPPRTGRSLESWLFSSVRFTCGDVFRRRARKPSVPHDHVPESEVEDDYDLGLDPALETALAHLTPEQRTIVHLKHVEGLDGNQIADVMGSNRVAVYAVAARAERRLRNLLATSPDPSIASLDREGKRG